MPPKVKVRKERIAEVAIQIVRTEGIGALTARKLSFLLGVSTQPIFSCFNTMDEVKTEVYRYAKELYTQYLTDGLQQEIPFLGVGKQIIRFVKEEKELYRLLFLTKPDRVCGGATESLKLAQDLVRESVIRIYNVDAETADRYFRNLWLVSSGICLLIVTDDCPYTDEQIEAVFSEVSISLCKAYKEIPGLIKGTYDKDAIFRGLVKK